LDDPLMQGLVEQLQSINRLADNSSGFVWRLQTEEGDATSIQLFEDPRIIVHLSLWASFEALKRFVYSGAHLEVLRSKRRRMEQLDALVLEQQGPTAAAFTFAKPYPCSALVALAN
jgi:hypothetical protein